MLLQWTRLWRMKQGGGMRVADQGVFLIFYVMKYFANYEADAVIREDDNGVRFIKKIEDLIEYRATKDNNEAWGIPSYGVFNELKPITKQEYDEYGITWDWSPFTGEKRHIKM